MPRTRSRDDHHCVASMCFVSCAKDQKVRQEASRLGHTGALNVSEGAPVLVRICYTASFDIRCDCHPEASTRRDARDAFPPSEKDMEASPMSPGRSTRPMSPAFKDGVRSREQSPDGSRSRAWSPIPTDGSRARPRSPLDSPKRIRSPSPPGPRDHSSSWMSGALFRQQGESYSEMYGYAIGSAGQDLRRINEGPSQYIRDEPNIGKQTLHRKVVVDSPRGHVVHGVFTGPAQLTDYEQWRAQHPHCRRTCAGIDPYHVSGSETSAMAQRPSSSPHTATRFATESRTSHRRAPHVLGRTAGQVFDRYSVTTRRTANSWRTESNSVKSILSHPMPTSARGSSFMLSHEHARRATAFAGGYQRMAPGKFELIPMMRSQKFGGGYPFA